MRRCGQEAGGTAVRIQVQGSVGGCGLGAWLQLALTQTLEITWSQPVTRALDIGGKPTPIAALAQSHSRRVPMPLSLLLMDPEELEMPSLVAQDHCWGAGNTESRGAF